MISQVQNWSPAASQEARLTIAIPTFNRNEVLNRTLTALLPQLIPDVHLVVIDNASDVPVELSSREFIATEPEGHVTLLRNRANVGGNANIMRCLELCETEYLWLLSDDDRVLPNAVATIMDTIKEHPEAIFINFHSELSEGRTAEVNSIGLEHFVDCIDEFPNILFISTSVYKVDFLKQSIRFGYEFTYSMAPHVVTLLCSIKDSHRCHLSLRQIVHWMPPGPKESFPLQSQALGVATLSELPLPWRIKVSLVRKALATRVRLEKLVLQLAASAVKKGDVRESLYIYKQIASRSRPFEDTWTVVKTKVYGMALRYPRLLLSAGRLMVRFVASDKLDRIDQYNDLNR